MPNDRSRKINTIKNLALKLFPINRSLTGKGNIETLKYIKKKINRNFIIKKVKSILNVMIGQYQKNGTYHLVD